MENGVFLVLTISFQWPQHSFNAPYELFCLIMASTNAIYFIMFLHSTDCCRLLIIIGLTGVVNGGGGGERSLNNLRKYSGVKLFQTL